MSFPISGFTAVPNPMMLSFLATQGFAIMYYGGAGWQFGKRKVSGMSNEEVNKMSPNDFLMKLHSETRTMVPTMAQGMKDMTPLIKTTIEEFGSYIREAVKAIPQAVGNIFGNTGEFSNVPTSESVNRTGLPPGTTAAFLHYFKTLSDATQKKVLDNMDKAQVDRLDIKDTSGQTIREFEEIQRKEEARLAVLRVNRPKQIQELTKVLGKPITGAIAPIRGNKKRAGQSQILERKRLIDFIAAAGRAVARGPGLSGKSGSLRRSAQRAYDFNVKLLRDSQQKLVNLLDRYRFQ